MAIGPPFESTFAKTLAFMGYCPIRGASTALQTDPEAYLKAPQLLSLSPQQGALMVPTHPSDLRSGSKTPGLKTA